MKRILIAVVAVATASFLAPVEAAAQNWYAGGYGGFNHTHDGGSGGNGTISYDLGMGIGGFVGYRMNRNLRLEGELTYRSNDLSSVGGTLVSGADLSSFSLIGNAYYDIPIGKAFTPYVGAGVGVTDATLTTATSEFSDTVIAIQLGAGVTYDLTPDLAMSLDYRLLGSENLRLGAGGGFSSVEYLNSSLFVGLRKSF